MRNEWSESIDEVELRPESLMMGFGYRPDWSEGALKPPIFQTSTFVFKTAEEGKRFFEVACGLRAPDEGERIGMIYSRLNNPDLEILEDRLTLWDGAERALVFSSGMAAIATTALAHLRPGDVVLHSSPVYGGTDHLLNEVLPQFGIESVCYDAATTRAEIEDRLAARRLGMIFVETPANPTNDLFDIELAAEVAAAHARPEGRPLVAVDNTFLGPIWQRPLDHGADLVLYSATKYLGGHSDLVAGVCLGSAAAMEPVVAMRSVLGTMADAWTGWLLMRSLETLQLRFDRQVETAGRLATFLAQHEKVKRVRYLGLLEPDDPQFELFKGQCLSPGAMISVELDGGEEASFRFLNSLQLCKLAVSLGGTETLVEHPATMTHAGVDPQEKERLGVNGGLVRISVGVEHPEDLILDLGQALSAV